MLKSEKKDFKLKVNKYFDTLKNVDSMGQIRYSPCCFLAFLTGTEKRRRGKKTL